MSSFENIFINLFFEVFKSSINLGKIPEFDHIFLTCKKDTGITEEHLNEQIINALKKRYENIITGNWLLPFIGPYVEEIIIHSPILVEIITNKERRFEKIEVNEHDYNLFLRIVILKSAVDWNHNTPFNSFMGSFSNRPVRYSLVHPSLTASQVAKCFMRFSSNDLDIKINSFMPDNICEQLIEQVNRKKNIIISGSTGSGKTTLLSLLARSIPQEEHVVTMEDSLEIKTHHSHWTRLVAKEDIPGKRMLDLSSYALRIRPDRILLGEMRSHEVVPFLLAINSGHNGAMCTIHANSASESLLRIGLLFELYSSKGTMPEKKVSELVCRNIDYVIFLEHKKVKEIIKVIGFDGERPFYEEIYRS